MIAIIPPHKIHGNPSICLVMHLPPPVNGVSIVSEHVLHALSKSQLTVALIPLRFASATCDIGKFRLSKLATLAKVAGDLFVTCLRRRPDLVYFTLTPSGNAFYRDVLYVAILKLFGVRRLYHLHGKGIREAAKGFARRFLYRWVFSGAKVILLAPRLIDDAAAVVEKNDCYFLSNGISDPLKNGMAVDRHAGNEVPRILFFSNIVISKGPFILLEALAVLHREGHAFAATFSGAWQSKKVENDFFAKLSDLGLNGKVAYIGSKFGHEKDAVFSDANIFAFPTYKDTFPLVILEAMAHGLPVVTTVEGAIPDIMTDGETGFLVPRKDVAMLTDRLRLLLADRALRTRMGRSGRERYEKYFTIEKFEADLVNIVEQCLFPAKGNS